MMKKKISLFLGVVEELIFAIFSNFNKKYKKNIFRRKISFENILF